MWDRSVTAKAAEVKSSVTGAFGYWLVRGFFLGTMKISALCSHRLLRAQIFN